MPSSTQIKLKKYGELIAEYKSEPRASDFEKAISFFVSLERNKIQASDSKDNIQDCVVMLMDMDTKDKDLGIICNRLKQLFFSIKRKQVVRSKRTVYNKKDVTLYPDEIFGMPNYKFIESTLDANNVEVGSKKYDILMSICKHKGYGERFLAKKHGIGYANIKRAKQKVREEYGIY